MQRIRGHLRTLHKHDEDEVLNLVLTKRFLSSLSRHCQLHCSRLIAGERGLDNVCGVVGPICRDRELFY
jgi:hypothetical protein